MRWIAAAGTILFKAYSTTLRIEIHLRNGTVVRGRDYSHTTEIFAVLERDLLAVAGLATSAHFTTMIAPGRDGDWAAAIASRLGCRVVRGSSEHHGAAALRNLVRRIRGSDGPAVIAVDGPSGPAGIAKGGAVACGLITGRPVRASAAASRWKVAFPATWSGIYLPLPFSRVVITIDDPLPLPRPPSLRPREQMTEELSRRLAAMAVSARETVATPGMIRRRL